MTLINDASFKPFHCLFNLSLSSKIITKITRQFCSPFCYPSFKLKSFSFRITSNYFKRSYFSNHRHFTYSWASSVKNHSLWAWLQSYTEGHSVEWYAYPSLVSSPSTPHESRSPGRVISHPSLSHAFCWTCWCTLHSRKYSSFCKTASYIIYLHMPLNPLAYIVPLKSHRIEIF